MPTVNDIQTFEFTHLEMAVIGAAVSTLRITLSEDHIMGHAINGKCHRGQKVLINTCKRINEMLDSKTDVDILKSIIANAMEGKYPE